MRHVLVVDDAVMIRALLRDILRREGYVVHEAVSARDAVARYREVRPDVVTMDLSLPDGSGIDCLIRLRGMDPAARIVVISAMSRDHVEAEALAAGALAFLSKPFRPEEVSETVRVAMSRRLSASRGRGDAG